MPDLGVDLGKRRRHNVALVLQISGPPAHAIIPSIVIATLDNFQTLVTTPASAAIDQPMFSIDSARPPPGQLTAKRLGLSYSSERIAPRVEKQRVDPGDDRRIG